MCPLCCILTVWTTSYLSVHIFLSHHHSFFEFWTMPLTVQTITIKCKSSWGLWGKINMSKQANKGHINKCLICTTHTHPNLHQLLLYVATRKILQSKIVIQMKHICIFTCLRSICIYFSSGYTWEGGKDLSKLWEPSSDYCQYCLALLWCLRLQQALWMQFQAWLHSDTRARKLWVVVFLKKENWGV